MDLFYDLGTTNNVEVSHISILECVLTSWLKKQVHYWIYLWKDVFLWDFPSLTFLVRLDWGADQTLIKLHSTKMSFFFFLLRTLTPVYFSRIYHLWFVAVTFQTEGLITYQRSVSLQPTTFSIFKLFDATFWPNSHKSFQKVFWKKYLKWTLM